MIALLFVFLLAASGCGGGEPVGIEPAASAPSSPACTWPQAVLSTRSGVGLKRTRAAVSSATQRFRSRLSLRTADPVAPSIARSISPPTSGASGRPGAAGAGP